LIVEGGAWVNFAALRIEDKGDGADVSLCVVGLDKPVAFRAAVLNAHGTIEAGINLLRRTFKLETPLWKFKAKRNEKEDRFDLFVIAHWQEWNEADILWDKRNSIAQGDKSGVSLGPMKLGAFRARCTRSLKLRYLPGYIG
jgi:hypothetical protein